MGSVHFFYKKSFLFFFAFTVLSSFLSFQSYCETYNASKAHFVKTYESLGSIYRGEKVKRAYHFQNTGKEPLVIRSSQVSCGCTKIQIFDKSQQNEKNKFLPNEEGDVVVEFDSTHFSGSISRAIVLETNSLTHKNITLKISAYIKEEILSQPALIHLGNIYKDSKESQSVRIKTFKKDMTQSARIIPSSLLDSSEYQKFKSIKNQVVPFKAVSSVPYLKASIGKNKNGYFLKVSTVGQLPIGPLRQKIIVINTSTHLPELVIPIIGEVLGHVKYTKYVEFGSVSSHAPVEKSVTLSSTDPNFAVTKVKIDLRQIKALKDFPISDFLNINVHRKNILSNKSRRKAVTTTIKSKMFYPKKLLDNEKFDDKSINISGEFVISTNDPDYKEIRVSFFGALRKNSYDKT